MTIWIMSSRLIKESWTSIFQAVSWNSQTFLTELLVWQVIQPFLAPQSKSGQSQTLRSLK